MQYAKIFDYILRSSVWREDYATRIVWITMLVLKDREHFVRATPDFIQRIAFVTPEECERALKILSSPDPSSHSPVEEGRRIRPVPGGWFIINGQVYADKLSAPERRAYKAAKEREYRRRRKTVERNGAVAGAAQAVKDGFKDLEHQ